MPENHEIVYDQNSIEVLEGLEPVRRRPGMYIGSTGTKGLNHLIYEIVDNSVDEHMAGYCSEIRVTLNKDGSCTVQDNGRGIPVGMHKKGLPAVRVVLTTLHAGGKFGDGAYKTSGGLHGVGSSAVNALSAWLDVEVSQDGYVHHDRYEKGVPVEQLAEDGLLPKIRPTRSHGTKITFLPDDTIFEKTRFRESDVKARLHEITYLNPGLKIIFKDLRPDAQEPVECVFLEEGGISKFVQDINASAEPLHDPIYFKGKSGDIEVECAIQYTDDFHENVLGFCNTIYNADGGTHITGFKTALTSIINNYARGLGILKEKDENFSGADVRTGLTAVVSIKHQDPRFEGQTKTKLDNPDASKATQTVTSEQLELFFDRNLEILKTVIGQAEKSAKIRKAEEKSKKNLLSKPKFSFDSNGKLANCNSKDASKCELFIVEGDSAGGSAKTARDREHQAILPIRGKILNVAKASMDKVLANEEIKTLIYALGTGFSEGYGNDFDISKLRYDKIVFACFTGDTEIKALDGKSYSFENLVNDGVKDLWVYSIDKSGNIVPALARDIRKTGESKSLVKVTLDNGETFTCTPDHMIMKVDGNYCCAESLHIGDSLMPLHTRIKDGYEEFYSKNDTAWIKTHKMVAQKVFQKEINEMKDKLASEDLPEGAKKVNVHHKDRNRRNNSPDNLQVMSVRDHGSMHLTEYNSSDEHRKRVKELWKQGAYSEYTFGGPHNKYNGSQKQKDDVKRAAQAGAYSGKFFATYNYSEKHKETVSQTNRSEKHIIATKRGSILSSIKYLQINGFPFDEYHYDYYRVPSALLYKNILEVFSSYEEAYEMAKDRKIDIQNYKMARDYSYYNNGQKQRKQIGNTINQLIQNGEEFTEENYNKRKSVRTVRYDDITLWFDSYEAAYEYAENYNHKVANIERIELQSPEPVYCCTVDTYHNFLLSSGVFVKNCDADIDVRLVAA